jgi:hypothetical protein
VQHVIFRHEPSSNVDRVTSLVLATLARMLLKLLKIIERLE